MTRTLSAALLLLLLWPAWAAGEPPRPETRTVPAGDREQIPAQILGDGRRALLWLAPGYGFRDSHRRVAAALA